jgi:DNA-binding response OmpR family regulator
VTVPGISADRSWSKDARLASVLIVEDDAGIATQLARGLELAGYETSSVGAGRDVPGRPAADVVLLDLGLPDADGVEVCRQLRARSDVAIIVVTARGEESDRVLALDEGADDYLVKPFGLAELLARIRAVLRRRRPHDGEVLRCGDLAVDVRAGKVTLAGREIALTPRNSASSSAWPATRAGW